MPKITKEMMLRIVEEAERMQYGKITLVITETSPDVDLIIETRARFPKDLPPRPGQLVSASRVHEG